MQRLDYTTCNLVAPASGSAGVIGGIFNTYIIVGVGLFFFFQAEDGIRDGRVTGVQTCALPISTGMLRRRLVCIVSVWDPGGIHLTHGPQTPPRRSWPSSNNLKSLVLMLPISRKIGRACVGKECRYRWSPEH